LDDSRRPWGGTQAGRLGEIREGPA